MAPGHGHGHGAKEKCEPLYDLTDGASAPDKELLRDVEDEDMRIVITEHSGRNVMLFYNAFASLSCLMLLVACFPVPLYKGHNGDSYTIWKAPGGNKWSDSSCDHQKQMFTLMQALAICSLIFGALNMAAAALQMRGKGHMGLTLILGGVATSLSLTSWAIMVHQFRKKNCYGVPTFANVGKLNAAFALTIAANGLQLFGMIDLGYYFYSYYTRSEYHEEEYRSLAGLAALLAATATLITAVGAAFPLWEAWSMSDASTYTWSYVRFGLWHVTSFDLADGLPLISSTLDTLPCTDFDGLIKLGRALGIICPIVSFVAYLGALGAVYKPFMKLVALGAGAASWVLLLILWAAMTGMFYKKGCGASVRNFQGYTMTEGMGMFTSAWVAMTLFLIIVVLKI